jgi:hypothetical protein
MKIILLILILIIAVLITASMIPSNVLSEASAVPNNASYISAGESGELIISGNTDGYLVTFWLEENKELMKMERFEHYPTLEEIEAVKPWREYDYVIIFFKGEKNDGNK